MSHVYDLTQQIDSYLKSFQSTQLTLEDYNKITKLLSDANSKLKCLDDMIAELEYDNKQKFDGIEDLRKQIDRYQRVLRVALES